MDDGGDGTFWTLHFGVGIAMSSLAPALVPALLATVATLMAGSQQALLARARTNA